MSSTDGDTPFAGQPMRVAVSALGPSLDDRVDERFGRAAFLLMVDRETFEVEAVDNSANRDALQAAGLGAAEAVAARDVKTVVTGRLGPKAFAALRIAGIAGFDGTGLTVREAVERLNHGSLEPLGEGEAHAGMA